jgi:predicted MFS family arabinose efflux permease
MQERSAQSPPVGYLQLLRRNKQFRMLWYGQLVSQLGDWFDSIAIFALLLRLTNSGTAVSLVLVAQFLPPAIIGLGAGVVVDRLPRKRVMIAADLVRAALVPLLLLIQSPDMVWLAYVATALKFAVGAFFEPARQAAIPSIVAEDELIAANAISSITWSAMLAIGAALGGVVVGFLGTTTAFVIDGLSFLLSAFFIARIVLPARIANQTSSTGLEDLREAARYLRHHPRVTLYAFTKGFWSVGSGALLLLSLYGRELFPLGKDSALSIGLLYAARGLGTGIGPVVASRFGGSTPRFLARAIAPSFVITGIGYACFGGAPSLAFAALAVMLAHTGGSTQWTFSTALLQMVVPDRLRGRIFAVELVTLTLMTSLSSYLVGLARDAGYAPRTLALVVSGIFVAASAPVWLLWRDEQHQLPHEDIEQAAMHTMGASPPGSKENQ